MKKETHLEFLTNRKNKYSIRKFSVGAASIMVGSLIFLSPQVGAEENDAEEASVEESAEEAAAEQTEEPAAEESTEEASVEENAEETAAEQTEEPAAEESTEEESVEAAQQADTTPPEILDVKVYEEMSDSGVDGEIPLITVEVTASDESEVPEVAAIFQEVGNPGNRQSTSLPTVEVNENGDYVVTASIVTEGEGTTYELIELKVADIHGNVTETTEYNQEVTTGEDTEEPPEEEPPEEEPDDGDRPGDGDESDGGQDDDGQEDDSSEDGQDGDDSGDGQDDDNADEGQDDGSDEEEPEPGDEPETIDEAYKSFRMSGYAGEQPDVFGYTAENGTITVVLPNGEEYVFEADENGNVDEVFPVALEDNTEITVILADSEGNSVEETLLYSSSPDPEEDEDQPEDGDDSDDGQEDDDSEDGQDGDASDDGQEDDGSEDEIER